jgi:hypothetical protein
MADPKIMQLLSSLYFLRGASENDLQILAQDLERRELASGDIIVQKGAPARGLFIILSGEAELLVEGAQSSQRLARLRAGDALGEMELAYNTPWHASARAIRPIVVLFWNAGALDAFLQTHPKARQALRFAARSQYLAQHVRFPWLSGSEVVYGLARKHPLMLLGGLGFPLLLLLGSVALGYWAFTGGGSAAAWGAAGIALVGLLWGGWKWLDWTNDYYIVTNKRVVWQEKVIGIYDNHLEAPLHMVLSVSAVTDILGRIFGYGNVVVRTYTGQIVFHNVSSPGAMASLLEAHWQRATLQRKKEDHQERELAISRLLEALPGAELPPLTDEPTQQEAPSPEAGLGRWSFQVRFEEGGVITYRKHWAILLRRIFTPSVVILLLLGFLGLRAGGMLTFLPPTGFFVGGILLLLGAILWWLYNFVDWANDIYQITPTQIVDIHRKPLSKETRKVAPLENILGTEVDRRGLLGIALNYGNVITNVGIEQFIFRGVYNPARVQQDIVSAIETLLAGEEEEDRRQRRQEMVEWLRAYHEQSSQRQEKPAPSERRPRGRRR